MSRPSPPPERLHLADEPGCLFPADGVTAWWYRPRRPGPRARAGVLVLPIQGGDYEVSALFAEAFADAGFHALRFERRAEWLEVDRDLDALRRLTEQVPRDVSRALDAWLGAGEVDPDRVGLFGVSMGAVMGTHVAATDPRIRAAVLCLGGTDLHAVLLDAADPEIRAYRQGLAARLGLPPDALRERLHAALGAYDTAHVAPRVPTDRTLVVAARFDRVVRWRYQVRLWEALGRPRRLVLPSGHYSAVVFVPIIRRAAVRWLDRGLVAPQQPGPSAP